MQKNYFKKDLQSSNLNPKKETKADINYLNN